MKLYKYLLLSLLFSACTNIQSEVVQVAPSFFDLKSYFGSEVEKLASVQQITKTTSINGTKETKTIDEVDFSQELAVFIESDINRLSWIDKYQVDSVMANGQLTQLQYQALSPKLRTRAIHIDFENEVVRTIKITNGGNSAIMNTSQDLTYEAGTGYTIRSEQAVKLMETRILEVEVAYR